MADNTSHPTVQGDTLHDLLAFAEQAHADDLARQAEWKAEKEAIARRDAAIDAFCNLEDTCSWMGAPCIPEDKIRHLAETLTAAVHVLRQGGYLEKLDQIDLDTICCDRRNQRLCWKAAIHLIGQAREGTQVEPALREIAAQPVLGATACAAAAILRGLCGRGGLPLRGEKERISEQQNASPPAPNMISADDLTDPEKWILQAMLRLKATSKDNRIGQQAILTEAGVTNPVPKNHSHAFRRLCDLGLVEIKNSGQAGGTWLTLKGVMLAQQLSARKLANGVDPLSAKLADKNDGDA